MKKRIVLGVLFLLLSITGIACSGNKTKDNELSTEDTNELKDNINDTESTEVTTKEIKEETEEVSQNSTELETDSEITSSAFQMPIETQVETQENTIDSVLTTEGRTEDAYIVQEVALQDKGVDVKYPQIEGMYNTQIQDKWNEIFYEDGYGWDDEYWGEDDSYTLEYEIGTQSPEMLSIIFRGSFFLQGSNHPYSFIKTYNIDLVTGRALRLPELADANKIASILWSKEGYEVVRVTKEELDNQVSSYYQTPERLASELNEFDYNEDTMRYPSGFSYQLDGKLVVILPTDSARGNFIEVIINS